MTRLDVINKNVPYPLSQMIINNVDKHIGDGRETDEEYLWNEVNEDWCVDDYGNIKIHLIIKSTMWWISTYEGITFWNELNTYFLNKNI